MTVKSKVAVITGGGTGIGKQTALLLAQEGADVVVLGPLADELELVRKEVETLSRRCLAYKANVADEDQVNAAIEASLKSLGQIDVLINNAAILGPAAPVAQLSLRSWTEEIAVNLTGSFLCCRAVLPAMMEQKSGKIINITSVAGQRAYPLRSAYAVSKAGLIALTRTNPPAKGQWTNAWGETITLAEVVEAGYTFPYLFDETQEVAKAYTAACTPDFFLFDPDRRLAYRGQFDSSRPGNGVPVTGEDLRAAIDAVMHDRPVSEDQHPSVGCGIKWRPGNEPDVS